MSRRSIFGLVSSIVLLVGAFLPIVQLPYIGTVNYWDLDNGAGKLVAVYAVAGIVLSVLGLERWLVLPAGIALLQVAVAYFDLDSRLRGSMGWFESLMKASGLYQSGSIMGVGWIVMIVGAILLGLTPFLPLNGGTHTRIPKGTNSRDDLNLFG